MRSRTIARAVAVILVMAATAAVRSHMMDMRRLRETGIATRNFLAGKVHADAERARDRAREWGAVSRETTWTRSRGGTRLPDGAIPSLAELARRGYIRLRTQEPTERRRESWRDWPEEAPG